MNCRKRRIAQFEWLCMATSGLARWTSFTASLSSTSLSLSPFGRRSPISTSTWTHPTLSPGSSPLMDTTRQRQPTRRSSLAIPTLRWYRPFGRFGRLLNASTSLGWQRTIGFGQRIGFNVVGGQTVTFAPYVSRFKSQRPTFYSNADTL